MKVLHYLFSLGQYILFEYHCLVQTIPNLIQNQANREHPILAHQYDKINFQTLWDVITKDIPELLGLLESLTKEITETLDDN